MSRTRRLLATAGTALACVCAPALIGCGDDDEPEVPPVGSTGIEGLESPPTDAGETETELPTDGSTTQEGEAATGGTASPATDAGHEGGGPDPGTEEAENAESNQTEEQPPTGGAGPSPTEAFEQFCEENPEACE